MALEGFGGRLKAIRQERGYTQNQLANFLGVTEQAVSKYEGGNSYPDIVMLDGISRVLDCSLDYLFQFKPGRKNLLLQDSIENQLETAKYLLPDIISLKFGEKLVPLFIEEIQRGGVHINSLREQMAQQWGILVPDVFSYSRLCQVIICLIRDLGYTASPLILIIEAMEKYVNITGVRELTEKIAVELGEGFQLKNWCSHDKKCVI